jgi:hypothetical protein
MMLALPLFAAGCAERAPLASDFVPEYLGADVRLLAPDLAQVRASMTKAQSPSDVSNYADCALVGFMRTRGYNYARLLRGNLSQEGGVSSTDAVYSLSPDLPEGIKVIDAQARTAECAQKRIPTV